MSDQDSEWQSPLTPWQVVQKRFFDGRELDPGPFAKKYGLDVHYVRQVFSNQISTFTPGMCAALGHTTKMSPDFFRNLSIQHESAMSARA